MVTQQHAHAPASPAPRTMTRDDVREGVPPISARRCGLLDGKPDSMCPILIIRLGCCVCAANGHIATALPKVAMKSRRLISAPRLKLTPSNSEHSKVRAHGTGWTGSAPCPLWVISGLRHRNSDVRFTPNSGHPAAGLQCPLSAIRRHRVVVTGGNGQNASVQESKLPS